MASLWPTVALVAAALAIGAASPDELQLGEPVRSGPEDLVADLPGLAFKPNFAHYSGYLRADDLKPTNRFWHYWLVESQSGQADSEPLVLWLNGGPGCSSMLGLLTELGPFRIADGQVVENKFAWNKNANVLFMESPAGVGYSYSVDGDQTANDDSTARQNYLALKSFFEKFPKYKGRPLYLTGESYGGVYLPTLAVLVNKDPELNLKGVAIGNGYLDARKLAESLVYFSYYHGLVGRTTWQGLSRECCAGAPPARGQCKEILSPNRSQSCSKFVVAASDEILNSGVNPYNLYDRCYGADSASLARQAAPPQSRGREFHDKQLMLGAFNVSAAPLHLSRSRGFSSAAKSFGGAESRAPRLGSDPPCTDDSIVIDYLNRPDVRKALHIPDALKVKFTTCSDSIRYTMQYPASADGLGPQVRELINSARKLTLLVYNGDVDLMCNFFGDEWFVDDLGRKVVRDYSPWYTNNQVSGFVKHFEGITYMTVKGSGHMVPTDKPAEALHMFEMFLGGMKAPQ